MDRTDRPGDLNISLVDLEKLIPKETCIVNRDYLRTLQQQSEWQDTQIRDLKKGDGEMLELHCALRQQSEWQDIQIRDLKKGVCAQQELMCTLQAAVTAGKEALEMEHIDKNRMAQKLSDMHDVLLRREEETDKLKQWISEMQPQLIPSTGIPFSQLAKLIPKDLRIMSVEALKANVETETKLEHEVANLKIANEVLKKRLERCGEVAKKAMKAMNAKTANKASKSLPMKAMRA